MEFIPIILTSVISCAATIVISVYAWLNYKLITKVHFFNINTAELYDNNRRKLDASSAANHRELADILRAVVISNLSANKSSETELKFAIKIFNNEYFGVTQLFSSEAKS